MPYRFTTGDIKSIAVRLGLQQVNSRTRVRKWNGTDQSGNFWQTYIHDHGDGVPILTGTAKQQATQIGFRDLEDMYDFLKDKKRRR